MCASRIWWCVHGSNPLPTIRLHRCAVTPRQRLQGVCLGVAPGVSHLARPKWASTCDSKSTRLPRSTPPDSAPPLSGFCACKTGTAPPPLGGSAQSASTTHPTMKLSSSDAFAALTLLPAGRCRWRDILLRQCSWEYILHTLPESGPLG